MVVVALEKVTLDVVHHHAVVDIGVLDAAAAADAVEIHLKSAAVEPDDDDLLAVVVPVAPVADAIVAAAALG